MILMNVTSKLFGKHLRISFYLFIQQQHLLLGVTIKISHFV